MKAKKRTFGEDIEKMFNPSIAKIVEGLTKIAKVKTDQDVIHQHHR